MDNLKVSLKPCRSGTLFVPDTPWYSVSGNKKRCPTYATCVLHLLIHFLPDNDPLISQILTIIAAVLPALASALAGIWVQGEFERIAHRSKGMEDELKKLSINCNSPLFYHPMY